MKTVPINEKNEIKTMRICNVQWINIINPKQRDIDQLKNINNFQLDQDQILSLLNDNSRPEVQNQQDESNLLIMKVPFSNAEENEMTFLRILIFWNKMAIITMQNENIFVLSEIFNNQLSLQKEINDPLSPSSALKKETQNYNNKILPEETFSPKNKSRFRRKSLRINDFDYGVEYIIFKIIKVLIWSAEPLLDSFSTIIDKIDSEFMCQTKNTIDSISGISNRIKQFLSQIKLQKKLIESLIKSKEKEILHTADHEENIEYLKELKKKKTTKQRFFTLKWPDLLIPISHLIEVSEDQNEIISGLSSTIQNRILQKNNYYFNSITIYSLIITPLALITGFYGMNTKLPLAFIEKNSTIPAFVLFAVLVVIGFVLGILLKTLFLGLKLY